MLPITKEILTEGFEVLTDPQNTAASPDGWHSDGTTTTTATAYAPPFSLLARMLTLQRSGNNVVTFKGAQTNTTTESSDGLNFIFTQDETQAPTVQVNIDAARTNAFYLVNTVHDISYIYGFTEAGFNFQNNNFGKGGAGNDRVTVSVQDTAGIDNGESGYRGRGGRTCADRKYAQLTSPHLRSGYRRGIYCVENQLMFMLSGQSGRMRMFLWDFTNPRRDGALENDIVVHENTHGITNRLTGGGTGRYVPSFARLNPQLIYLVEGVCRRQRRAAWVRVGLTRTRSEPFDVLMCGIVLTRMVKMDRAQERDDRRLRPGPVCHQRSRWNP